MPQNNAITQLLAPQGNMSDFMLSDPAIQRLGQQQFAAQLLQGVAPGQTPLGAFGSALTGSIDYLQKLREAEGAKQVEAERYQTQQKQKERQLTVAEQELQAKQTTAKASLIRALTTAGADAKKAGIAKRKWVEDQYVKAQQSALYEPDELVQVRTDLENAATRIWGEESTQDGDGTTTPPAPEPPALPQNGVEYFKALVQANGDLLKNDAAAFNSAYEAVRLRFPDFKRTEAVSLATTGAVPEVAPVPKDMHSQNAEVLLPQLFPGLPVYVSEVPPAQVQDYVVNAAQAYRRLTEMQRAFAAKPGGVSLDEQREIGKLQSVQLHLYRQLKQLESESKLYAD